MRQGGRVFYGWVIVGVSAFVFAVVRGVNDAFGVFFVALVDEFGWSRAAIAGVFSSVQLTGAAVALGVGMLSDRVSVRRLVPLSACLIALGLVLASRAQSLAMLYVAYGCIFALGYCGVGELTHVPLIARWFVTRRGTAIGVAMAGMGVGILFIVPLAQMCIHHLGWRGAYLVLAALVLLGVIPPTLLWQRDRPEELGLWPDGIPPPSQPSRFEGTVRQPRPRLAGPEWTLRTALGTPTLWLLWVMPVLTPLGMMMVVPHHVAYLVGHCFDPTVAAWETAEFGVFNLPRLSRPGLAVRSLRPRANAGPELWLLHHRHDAVAGTARPPSPGGVVVSHRGVWHWLWRARTAYLGPGDPLVSRQELGCSSWGSWRLGRDWVGGSAPGSAVCSSTIRVVRLYSSRSPWESWGSPSSRPGAPVGKREPRLTGYGEPRSRPGAEQRADASGQPHSQRTPEGDAHGAHRHTCPTHARRHLTQECEAYQ